MAGAALGQILTQLIPEQNGQVISSAIQHSINNDFLITNVIKRHIASTDQLAVRHSTAGNQDWCPGFRKLLQRMKLVVIRFSVCLDALGLERAEEM